MVDAEQHRTHRRYPCGVPGREPLEEKPEPEPPDDPHDGVEGVHYSLALRPGDTSPPRALRAAADGRFLSRRSFPTRRCHRHTPTTSIAASARRPARPSQRSARCTSAMMALI